MYVALYCVEFACFSPPSLLFFPLWLCFLSNELGIFLSHPLGVIWLLSRSLYSGVFFLPFFPSYPAPFSPSYPAPLFSLLSSRPQTGSETTFFAQFCKIGARSVTLSLRSMITKLMSLKTSSTTMSAPRLTMLRAVVAPKLLPMSLLTRASAQLSYSSIEHSVLTPINCTK